MRRTELLTVESAEELETGTVLWPGFPVPDHKNWGAAFETWVVGPDGESAKYLAYFMLWNVSIAAPLPGKRLPPKIAILIPNVSKKAISPGSKVLVQEHTNSLIFGGADD